MDTHLSVRAALDQAVYQYSVLTADQQLAHADGVLRSGQLTAIGGQHVPDLEAHVAQRIGRRGAVATASATAGIELALRCLPVRRPGWAIVVPEVCWASVATAVHHAGGTVRIAPVTADLTPHWEQIEPLLTSNVTAVVLAHVRGRPAPDTTRIAAELAARGVPLIEDCAQAWAVTADGRPAGSVGTLAVFSTQQWKLISTGEGGVVAADDPDLLDALRAVGGDTRFSTPGDLWRGNCRMSELAAASALPQLHGLDALTARLRGLQERLVDRALQAPPVHQVLPAPDGVARSNGSIVGAWLPFPDDARRAADRLYRAGIRHWHPSTGDEHLAINWPIEYARSELDLTRYLDIQIPVLDEHHHDEFVDAAVTALIGDTKAPR